MPWRQICISLISLTFVLTQCSLNVSAKQNVYISEVNFAGSTRNDCKLCSYDKWVEITNPTDKAIDVSFWQLRFQESQDTTNNLKFPPNTFIQAKSNYLVRNRYNGVASTLNSVNLQADAVSGKILRVSSNSVGQRRIQASLYDASGQKIFYFNLQEEQIKELETVTPPKTNSKYSIIYNPASLGYEISTLEYFTNNFGTPKVGTGAIVDLDTEPAVEVQTIFAPAKVIEPTSILEPEKPKDLIEPSKVPIYETAQIPEFEINKVEQVESAVDQTTVLTKPITVSIPAPSLSDNLSEERISQLKVSTSAMAVETKSPMALNSEQIIGSNTFPQTVHSISPVLTSSEYSNSQTNKNSIQTRLSNFTHTNLSSNTTSNSVASNTHLELKNDKINVQTTDSKIILSNATDKQVLELNLHLWPLTLILLVGVLRRENNIEEIKDNSLQNLSVIY